MVILTCMLSEAPQERLRQRNRQLARDVVLDAAERLLQESASAEFPMRALAAEAGVGFATPFNHFGSKNAIMQAISTRLIARMAARFNANTLAGDAFERVLAMGAICVALLLEHPEVSKAVVGWLGVCNAVPTSVRPRSEAIWSLALGDCSGLTPKLRGLAHSILPQQLAFTFRGCVSFWIAGKLSDQEFGTAFSNGAAAVLLGFAGPKRRAQVSALIKPIAAPRSASRSGG